LFDFEPGIDVPAAAHSVDVRRVTTVRPAME